MCRTWEVLKTETETQLPPSRNNSRIIGVVQTYSSYWLLELNVLELEDVLKIGHFVYEKVGLSRKDPARGAS